MFLSKDKRRDRRLMVYSSIPLRAPLAKTRRSIPIVIWFFLIRAYEKFCKKIATSRASLPAGRQVNLRALVRGPDRQVGALWIANLARRVLFSQNFIVARAFFWF